MAILLKDSVTVLKTLENFVPEQVDFIVNYEKAFN